MIFFHITVMRIWGKNGLIFMKIMSQCGGEKNVMDKTLSRFLHNKVIRLILLSCTNKTCLILSLMPAYFQTCNDCNQNSKCLIGFLWRVSICFDWWDSLWLNSMFSIIQYLFYQLIVFDTHPFITLCAYREKNGWFPGLDGKLHRFHSVLHNHRRLCVY